MSEVQTLFHGSRNKFTEFDAAFYRTGENAGHYNGWYFCSTREGALYHCQSYLKCDVQRREGYVLICEIDKQFLDEDVDGMYTEKGYGPPIYGVPLRYSAQIEVVGIVSALEVFVCRYGKFED